MIVGHKIEQYLTAERSGYGEPWKITTHRVVTELHATKGWRRAGHARHVQHVRRLPPIKDWREANVTVFERARKPLPGFEPVDWLDAAPEHVRHQAINRHKVRRLEIQRAKNAEALAAGF